MNGAILIRWGASVSSREPETMKLTDQASAVVSDLEIQAFAGGNDQATRQLVTDYTANLHEIGYL